MEWPVTTSATRWPFRPTATLLWWGRPGHNHLLGAAYTFQRNGCSWSQAQELTASNPQNNDRFGFRVALSADGGTALVGTANGSEYVFARSGTSWSQQAVLS